MTLVFPKYRFVINRSNEPEPEPEPQDSVIIDGSLDANGNLATDSSVVLCTFGTPQPIQNFTLKVSCDFFRYGGANYYLPCQLVLSENISHADGTGTQGQLNFSIINYNMGFYVGTGAYSNGFEFDYNMTGNYQYSPVDYVINVNFSNYSDTHYQLALPTGTIGYKQGSSEVPPSGVTYSAIGKTVIIPKTCKINGFVLQNFNYSRLRTNVNNSYVEIAGKKHYAIPT